MTVTRTLLIMISLAFAGIALLAKGNPQWGPAFYLFQAKLRGHVSCNWATGVWNHRQSEVYCPSCGQLTTRLAPPDRYVGPWTLWCPSWHEAKVENYTPHRRAADLIQDLNVDPPLIIYNESTGLDRRAEFGLPVE